MGFRSLLISLLAVLLLVCSASAEPKYKTLQADVIKLKTTLAKAKNALKLADRKVLSNVKLQRNAKGAALARLKKDGLVLSKAASKATKLVSTSLTNLANKQGEVRAAAASFAATEVNNEKHKLVDRIREVISAIEAWAGAIGKLPAVPEVRNTTKIADPAEKVAIKADDKNALKAFMGWADAEIKRLDSELEKLGKVLAAEARVKNQDDGAKMISDVKSLKKKISGRKSVVKSLKATAKKQHKALK